MLGATASMSHLGQSRHLGDRPTTSGLLPETDILSGGRYVSKVPTTATNLGNFDLLCRLIEPRVDLLPQQGEVDGLRQ
jgi:hypothetical protein